MACAARRIDSACVAASASTGEIATTPGSSMAARCASSISRRCAIPALAKPAARGCAGAPPNTGAGPGPGTQVLASALSAEAPAMPWAAQPAVNQSSSAWASRARVASGMGRC